MIFLWESSKERMERYWFRSLISSEILSFLAFSAMFLHISKIFWRSKGFAISQNAKHQKDLEDSNEYLIPVLSYLFHLHFPFLFPFPNPFSHTILHSQTHHSFLFNHISIILEWVWNGIRMDLNGIWKGYRNVYLSPYLSQQSILFHISFQSFINTYFIDC